MTNGDFDIQGHFRTVARHPLLNVSGRPGTRGTRTGAAPVIYICQNHKKWNNEKNGKLIKIFKRQDMLHWIVGVS